ncbi:MAG: tetratricopeptide repeat protein [Chloroflexi bacterium]|nr:tetratricopeptide repeat protein [Chloroflexota bacterium]
MAEGQARSFGYDSANQYFKQALDVDPRSVYALVSYGLFKLDLGSLGEAERLIKEAANRCTKQTGYYVYFSLSKVYNETRDRYKRAEALRRALEYEPDHTIAKHSLGVALSQMGNFDQALAIFNNIIADELARTDGPTESLVYALKTKIITLRRARRASEASAALQDALNTVRNNATIRHLEYQLRQLVDDELTTADG